MNTKIIFPFAACIGMAMAFVSCQETDTEAPSVCTETGAVNSVLAAEIEAVAGDHIDIEDLFCDNEALVRCVSTSTTVRGMPCLLYTSDAADE